MFCKLLPCVCVRPSVSEVVEPSLASISPGAASEVPNGGEDSKGPMVGLGEALSPLSPEALHLMMENAVVISRAPGKASSTLTTIKDFGLANPAVHELYADAAQQESNRRTVTVSSVGSALGLPVPPSAEVMATAQVHPYTAGARRSKEGLQLQPVLEDQVAGDIETSTDVSADAAPCTPCPATSASRADGVPHTGTGTAQQPAASGQESAGAGVDLPLYQSPSPSPSGPPITTHFDLAAIASSPLAHLASVMTAADAQEQQQQLAQQQLLQTRNVREHAAAAASPAAAPLPMPYTRPITAADILTGACSTRALAPARAPWGATVTASPLHAMYSPLHLGLQPQANMAATVAAVLKGQHLHTQAPAVGAARTPSTVSGDSGGPASSASPATSTATSIGPVAPAVPPGPLHMAQDRQLEQPPRASMTPHVTMQSAPTPPLPPGPLVSGRATQPQTAACLTPLAGAHTPGTHGYLTHHTPPSGGSSNHLSSSYLRPERTTHKPRVQIDANTLRGPNVYGFQPVLIMSPQELARQQAAQGPGGGGSRRLGSMAAGSTLFSRASGRQQAPNNQYGDNGRHGYTGAGQVGNAGYGAGAGQPVRSKIGSASSRMALSALSNGSAYSTTSRGGRAAGPVDFRPRWR